MVFTVLEAVYPTNDSIVLVSALLHAPLYLYISYGMVRYVFADERVTSDEIYAVGGRVHRGRVGLRLRLRGAHRWSGPARSRAAAGAGDQSWFELLFLSFTTLTSTGLSDITPVLAHARSLSMVEQVTGVFYIAFVVARMVALTVVRRRPENP